MAASCCCSGVTFARTDASVVMSDVTWATSRLRMGSVTSSPSSKTCPAATTIERGARWSRSSGPSRAGTPARMTLSARARYIAPVGTSV